MFTEGEARALYGYKNFTGFLGFKAVTERLRTAEITNSLPIA